MYIKKYLGGDFLNQIMQWLEKELGLSPAVQSQIFRTVLIIVILAIAYRFIKKFLYRSISDSKSYYRWKKTASYLFVVVGFIVVGRVWFMGVRSLTTFLGLFSAGLAIALKDSVMNIAGWAYVIWKRPFRVGDRVEIDGVAGDIIDIELFEFAMMEIRNWVHADQSTGRIVYIPNSAIFSKPLFNYSKGIPFIWDEIPIHISFESNWKKAKMLLEKIAQRYGEAISDQAESSIKEASRKFMLFNAKLDPTVYTSMDNENGITLTIRYMCSYRNRRDRAQSIYEDVLTEFAHHEDIELAYPTQRVYDRPRETKM